MWSLLTSSPLADKKRLSLKRLLHSRPYEGHSTDRWVKGPHAVWGLGTGLRFHTADPQAFGNPPTLVQHTPTSAICFGAAVLALCAVSAISPAQSGAQPLQSTNL